MTDENLAAWAMPYVDVGGLFGVGFDTLFYGFKYACTSSASELSVPDEWNLNASNYLINESTPQTDRDKIIAGSARRPTYYSGGLILDLNSNAGAMTLDDCVFVRSGNWDPNTYIHEMVHVGQYGDLGPEGFLTVYFGSSALEILRRWASDEPTDPMTASYLETEAYEIGNRFDPAHAR
jgi:hypothetical protein